jgi:hypothetical protein
VDLPGTEIYFAPVQALELRNPQARKEQVLLRIPAAVRKSIEHHSPVEKEIIHRDSQACRPFAAYQDRFAMHRAAD